MSSHRVTLVAVAAFACARDPLNDPEWCPRDWTELRDEYTEGYCDYTARCYYADDPTYPEACRADKADWGLSENHCYVPCGMRACVDAYRGPCVEEGAVVCERWVGLQGDPFCRSLE